MNHKKVSIIIPTYNTVDVISKTLKSVENQTYKNYEVIIINDGSTDGTKELLDDYKKGKNNVIIYHQSNHGVSAARNKGIELSTGEFICFLDSDDIYDQFFLEKMILKLSEINDDFDAVCCQCIQESEDKSLKKLILNDIVQIDDLINSINTGVFLHLSNFMINRKYLINNSIFFDTKQAISEDVLFLSKILLYGKVKAVNHFLFTYKYRFNSAVHTMSYEKKINDILGWIKVKKVLNNSTNIKKNEICLIEIDDLLWRKYLYLYRDALNEFNLNKSKRIKKIIYHHDDLKKINLNKYKKSERRIYSYLKTDSFFKMIIGCVYYKYIRRSL